MATRTHFVLIFRLPAFKSKSVFEKYQDSQFLKLLSYGGAHRCVATYRTELRDVLYSVMFCTLYLNSTDFRKAYLLLDKERFPTPLAVSHKPSSLGTFSAKKQSLVHRDIKSAFHSAIKIAY